MSQSVSKVYQNGLRAYLGHLDSLPDRAERPTYVDEMAYEALRDWSATGSLHDLKRWFLELRSDCPMQVEDIPLNACRGWIRDTETGDIRHDSGDFFRVHGLRIGFSTEREVTGGWDQPILTQVGYDGGLLGLLRQRIDGVPHYLVEAKAEPGNYEKLQLSPTLQATFSNLRASHKGRRPHFADLFERPEEHPATVLYDAWLSEDGGRLHLKRNRGMLVDIDPRIEVELPSGAFRWVSLFQIKALLRENAWINPHIRGIIAHA